MFLIFVFVSFFRISDEWLPESTEPFLKTVNIKQMKPAEKNKVESLLMTAYKMPYSPTIFENNYALSQQYHQPLQIHSNSESTEKQTAYNNEHQDSQHTNELEDNNDEDEEENEDGDSEDEEEDSTTTAETTSSYQNVLTITNIQRKKHPRKQQNRIIVTR